MLFFLVKTGGLMSNSYTWIALAAAALWLMLIFPLTHDVEELDDSLVHDEQTSSEN